MDLDNMKKTWQEASEFRAQDSLLHEDMIRRITHEKSSSRLQRIIVLESSGLVLAVGMLMYLSLNFNRLDTWLNQLGGYGTMAILLISIAMGIRLIRQASKINIKKNSYSKTLEDFGAFKKSLGFYKRMSIVISIFIPFMLLPVLATLWAGKDLLTDFAEYQEGLLLSFILIPIILYTIFYFYRKSIRNIGKAFKEMED